MIRVRTVKVHVELLWGSANSDEASPKLVVVLVDERLRLAALEDGDLHERLDLGALVEGVATNIPLEVLEVVAVFAAPSVRGNDS